MPDNRAIRVVVEPVEYGSRDQLREQVAEMDMHATATRDDTGSSPVLLFIARGKRMAVGWHFLSGSFVL